MSTITLTIAEYEELVRACEKAEAQVEVLNRAAQYWVDTAYRYQSALEQIIDLNAGSFPLPWDTQNIARAALKGE